MVALALAGAMAPACSPAVQVPRTRLSTKDLVFRFKPSVVRIESVMGERCQADAWSAAAIDCMAKATADTMKACGDQLTPAQQQGMAKAMNDQMGGMKKDESMPSEPDPSEGSKAMDPCAGGE